MKSLHLVLLAVFLPGTSATEAPPYQRLLQGDDARKAAALTKRIAELWPAGKVAEAMEPAAALLALRQKAQGKGHWQTVDAALTVETLRRAMKLPEKQRQELSEMLTLQGKAHALNQHGQYAAAEAVLPKVLEVGRCLLGEDHPYVATTYNNLAFSLFSRQRYAEAAPLYQKALDIARRALGEDHPATATAYDNAARNLEAQARRAEAAPLMQKALDIRRRVLGEDHPDTATAYDNAARNLEARSRPAEAAGLYRKALDIRRRLFGEDHPDTAGGYNNVAVNLYTQGRYGEADPLFRKALDICRRVLGQDHPHTAQVYYNIARNLEHQGRYVEAAPFCRKALDVCRRVLGEDHPLTAACYNDFAFTLSAQGRYAAAAPLFQKALDTRRRVLGDDHPDTGQTYMQIAIHLSAQGRHAEAAPLFQKALAIRRRALGEDHADTASNYSAVALNLYAQGKHGEAAPLLQKVLDIRRRVLGDNHPDTADSYNSVAGVLAAQGRYAEAVPLFKKALDIARRALGENNRGTAGNYNNVAFALQAQGRYAEAETYWRSAARALEAARLSRAVTGFERAITYDLYSHLGLAVCLARQGKPDEAWRAAESGLARGLLDDLAARVAPAASADQERRGREQALRLEQLDRLLLPLLTARTPSAADRKRQAELTRERTLLQDEMAREGAELARGAVLSLEKIQQQLAAGAALVFWLDGQRRPNLVDPGAWHWGCVVRRVGPPAWVRLPGSGPGGAWTDGDNRLPGNLQEALANNDPGWPDLARRLAAQRLAPLEPHLAATKSLPAADHLIVVPVTFMAGVPLDVLSDRYTVNYVPSGSVFARLREQHRPLRATTLLALGDPAFQLPTAPPPPPPDHGLYLTGVLPGGNAHRAGLRAGDVLLNYGGKKLTTPADLKLAADGEPVSLVVWRNGRTLKHLKVAPGRLGLAVSRDPPAVVLRREHEQLALADPRRRDGVKPLPGTRFEVEAVRALFPGKGCLTLLGSEASEQRLEELAAGRLKEFRVLHLATHGRIDRRSARDSALLLARDRLPDPLEQAGAGGKVHDGRLTVDTIADTWQLDADLVTLSACQTGLGPSVGGEGLLGFSHVLFAKGARSLVLSLWQVDDTATALLMTRFYENLLGKRAGLKGPLGRAAALREAQRWLRGLSRAEAEKRAAALAAGVPRGEVVKLNRPVVPAPRPGTREAPPFAHPFYWAAFILLGDPD
jgi:tetratricopeptide (TPR) repeat protein